MRISSILFVLKRGSDVDSIVEDMRGSDFIIGAHALCNADAFFSRGS